MDVEWCEQAEAVPYAPMPQARVCVLIEKVKNRKK